MTKMLHPLEAPVVLATLASTPHTEASAIELPGGRSSGRQQARTA
jgi:hypothetical protein